MRPATNKIHGSELTAPERAGACGYMFALTAAYVGSFALVTGGAWLRGAAVINLAAAVAWIGFGGALAIAGRRRDVRVADWFDACLSALTPGVLMLLGGAAVNVLVAVATGLYPLAPGALGAALFVGFHLALLGATNVVMAIAFVGASSRLGVAPPRALVLWLAGLDGTFLVALAAAWRLTGGA